jgi:hypothetical protein
MSQHNRKLEGGSALFVAVVMLVMMGFLGLGALNRVTLDEQVSGFQNRARTAFYAAEGAIAEARRIVQVNATNRGVQPAFHTAGSKAQVGDATLYDREGGNLPSYYGDPAFPQAIRYLKDGGPVEGFSLQPGQGLVKTLWQINVLGESPDGSSSRLEVVAVVQMGSTASGYH